MMAQEGFVRAPRVISSLGAPAVEGRPLANECAFILGGLNVCR